MHVVPQGRQGLPLTDYASLDAVGLAAAIAAGEISPREAVESAIARAEQVEPSLNALVVPDFERALDQADSPVTGVFAGVPTVIKDNTDVIGLPTRQGSETIPPTPAKADHPFTRWFRETGVVIIGKSSMPEYGFNATTEFAGKPPTRNPWNLEYSTGASSGGSAALVAAGVIPIAHANDGGGSIRIPAAACGLVGLKTTRGQVVDPIEAAKLPVNILTNGVVTRTVRDTAAFLAAAGGAVVDGPASRRMRIGLLIDSNTGTPTDQETRAAVTDTARLFEKLGHEVVEVPVPVPDRIADDFSHYWGLLAFGMLRSGRRFFGPDFDPDKADAFTQGLAAQFRRQMWKTPRAIAGLRRTTKQYARAMDEPGIDAVLSPMLSHTTPRLGYLSPEVEFDELFRRLVAYNGFAPLHNASGAPAITVPATLTAEGLPIGIQLSARWGDEKTLLELAYELEAERPFPTLP